MDILLLIIDAQLLVACMFAINRNALLKSRCNARAQGKVLTCRESTLDDGPTLYKGASEFKVNGTVYACECFTSFTELPVTNIRKNGVFAMSTGR